MAMDKGGLTKLIEECGELTQIAAKKQAYFDVDDHPDGVGSMKVRMEEEIADVAAASMFVIDKFDLDVEAVFRRICLKLNLFKTWDNDQNA